MSVFDTISPKDSPDPVSDISPFVYKTFIIYPKFWRGYPNRVDKLKWLKVKFDAEGIKKLPDNKKGIYSFIAEPRIARHYAVGYLLYVGETHDQTLRARCTSYLAEHKKKNKRVHIYEMMKRWPDHLWVHYAVIEDESLIPELEEDLIAAFIPPFNRKFPAKVSELRRAAMS